MTTAQPPSSPPPTSTPSATLTRTLSYTLLLTSPLLLALPPRKLDLYTFSLLTAFGLSAQHLYSERRARLAGLSAATPTSLITFDGIELPTSRSTSSALPTSLAQQNAAEFARQRREGGDGKGEVEEEGGIKAMARKVWMGDEREGWKERRIREDREKLEEGRGYGGLIMDQIREVWGVKDDEEDGAEKGER